EEQGSSFVDFLMARAESDEGSTATPAEICHEVTPALDGAEDLRLHLVFGRADPRDARMMLGYLLAEERAGLIQARLVDGRPVP
ncbi:unnamed protein product, partial [marine sediment metagenome]